MLLAESTYAVQSSLAGYCRTGHLSPIAGIHNEHITEYRRLVINVVMDILANAYPLTRQLLTEHEWELVVEKFFANHSCQSPQVWLMPGEFRSYLIDTTDPLLALYPQLEDLLLFEWTETELYMMEDITAHADPSGDILFSGLVMNPEHRLLRFSYPVHREKPAAITTTDNQDYYVVAHRNREGDVLFTDLSPALCQLLLFLVEEPRSIKELFNLLEKTSQIILTTGDQQQVIAFIEKARQLELITGFKN
jgi:uncharacterized protein